MKPLVSIIVPVYNVEKYVQKCIKSIIAQTYTNIEIIIVDDGSTDASGELCDLMGGEDSRIRVVHKNNGGVVSARKVGLQYACGDYIGFVDGDDYIENNMYECLLEKLLDSGGEFVHMGYIKERANGKLIFYCAGERIISLNDNSKLEAVLETITESKNSISPSIWSKLFKADFIRNCHTCVPEGQFLGEDLICLCKCLLEAKTIALCGQTLYHYVEREDSATHRNSIRNIVEYSKLYIYICRLLEEYNLLNTVQSRLDAYLKKRVLWVLKQENGKSGFEVTQYCCPNIDEIIDKKVVIYGAGKVGRDYYAQISKYQQCRIVAWTDKNYEQIKYDYAKILKPEEILKLEYDLIIIAVNNKELAEEMRKILLDMGVDEVKIKWHQPKLITMFNGNYNNKRE